MNFDKFKNIDMPDVKVEPDSEYLEKINKLPYRAQSGRILSVVGTIAAAILIVLAVGLWAIIGRGVRGTNTELYAADGADINSAIELDASEWSASLIFWLKYDNIPLFDKTQPPSVVEMLDFYHSYNSSAMYDRSYEGKFINSLSLQYFGVTYPLDESRSYQNSGTDDIGKSYQPSYEPKAKKVVRYDMADGKYNYVVTYTLKDSTYVFSFIASDTDNPRPERYVLHTTADKPLKKDYTDEKIFYTLEKKIFSDPNVKGNWLWLTVGDVYKITETLYSAKISVNYIELHDPNIEMFPYNQQYYPQFFEYVDGELVISENQNRKTEGETVLKESSVTEWPTDKKIKNSYKKYVTKYGLITLPEFDGKRINANELSPENEDCEFEITYIYMANTVYNEMYQEIWFATGGKEYKVGFIATGGDFEIECLLFKKENKLYTGNEQTLTMQFENLIKTFNPYSYKASEIENNIPNELLLGQSMGIETPNIDTEMIVPYDDGPLKEMPEEYYEELEHIKEHGGNEQEVRSYYENMNESTLLWLRTQNNMAPKDDVVRLTERFVDLNFFSDSMRLSEYMCLERYYKNRYGYRFYTDKFTQDELLELKERGIVPNDIDYLLEKLGTPEKILKASDKKLKSILTDYYNQKYIDAFGHKYNPIP